VILHPNMAGYYRQQVENLDLPPKYWTI